MTDEKQELLTDLEKEVVQKAGTLWSLINSAIPEGPSREGDLRELAFHIHGIQRAFMCNAAARAYPTEFRPIGGSIEDSPLDVVAMLKSFDDAGKVRLEIVNTSENEVLIAALREDRRWLSDGISCVDYGKWANHTVYHFRRSRGLLN